MEKIVPLWDESSGEGGLLKFIFKAGLNGILARDPFYHQESFRLKIVRSIIEKHKIPQNQITQLQKNIEKTSEAILNGRFWKQLTSSEFGYDLFSPERCERRFLYAEIIGIWIIAGLNKALMISGEPFSENAAEAMLKRLDVSEIGLKEFLRENKLPLPSALFAKEADSTENVVCQLNDMFTNSGDWQTIVDWKEFESITARIIKNLRAGITLNSKAIFTIPGLKWKHIKITLESFDPLNAENNILKFTNLLTKDGIRKNCIELGLSDRRGGKFPKPKKLWNLLYLFAMFRGTIAKTDKAFNKEYSKQNLSDLRKLFKAWFPTIDGNPFESARETEGYRLAFRIIDKTDNYLQDALSKGRPSRRGVDPEHLSEEEE